MRVEHSVLVVRPPATVYAFVSDPSNLPAWQPEVTAVRCDGPLAVGSTFTEVRTFMGKRFETTLAVDELDPDRVFGLRVVEGPVPISVRHTFTPEGGGTRVTISGEGDASRLPGFASALVERQVRKRLQADLARLKTVLERDG
jgi:carbon monoxide dehydrogenase subunit G